MSLVALILFLIAGVSARGGSGAPDRPAASTPYTLRIGALPPPHLPADNPLTVERVALGQRLFNERMLSRDGSLSCASCHQAAHAFTDPRPLSPGVGGAMGTRHPLSLLNMAWNDSFFWDGRALTLRAQAMVPIQQHNEMDMDLPGIVARLSAMPDYPGLFARAFDSSTITPGEVGLALENYVLTLTSFDSKYDQSLRGEVKLSPLEQRGKTLFFTQYDPGHGQRGADCFHCHAGPLFTDQQFHNNGLDDGADTGRFKITGNPADMDKFATPSLRNVALSGPYMHDGRFKTLDEVIDHYAHGVRRSGTLDPILARHPESRLPLSDLDKQALAAFLDTLTDPKIAAAAAAPIPGHLPGEAPVKP